MPRYLTRSSAKKQASLGDLAATSTAADSEQIQALPLNPSAKKKKTRVFHGLAAETQIVSPQPDKEQSAKRKRVSVQSDIAAASILDARIDKVESPSDEPGAPDISLPLRYPAEQAISESPATEECGSPTKKKKIVSFKGFTPDVSPFPEWEAPSSSTCHEVLRILDQHHAGEAKHKQPERVPAPSLQVAGCGEVESVLDALLRTYLSGATTMKNADQALRRLVETFGTVSEGLGKGSIDWNAVRLARQDVLMEAIKPAGLAQKKSTYIKEILDEVQRENLERVEALLGEQQDGVIPHIPGATTESPTEKSLEIRRVEHSILSLEHVRSMTRNEAIAELVKFKGIGVKTAACVTLFCLRMPCFAVDTHVHRFCKWLGWVPPTATEIQTFNHCEIHVPDEDKYALHQLFIIHGQECHRCKANTRRGTKDWNDCVCPLEHLVQRGKAQSATAKSDADGTEPITSFFQPDASAQGDAVDEPQDDDETQIASSP